MARELLRSVDGRQLPNLGEVAVYWPHQDYPDIFDTAGFSFDDEPSISGERDGDEYPELIEHDAEETAYNLLAALKGMLEFPSGQYSEYDGFDEAWENAQAIVAKAEGRG